MGLGGCGGGAGLGGGANEAKTTKKQKNSANYESRSFNTNKTLTWFVNLLRTRVPCTEVPTIEYG